MLGKFLGHVLQLPIGVEQVADVLGSELRELLDCLLGDALQQLRTWVVV